MTPLRRRMIEQLKLDGKQASSIESYVDGVAQLGRFYNKCPSKISDEEIRKYFVHLIELGRAPRTLNVRRSGLLFLYRHVLNRVVPFLEDFKAGMKRRQLPIVLGVVEVLSLLRHVKKRLIV